MTTEQRPRKLYLTTRIGQINQKVAFWFPLPNDVLPSLRNTLGAVKFTCTDNSITMSFSSFTQYKRAINVMSTRHLRIQGA